MPAGRRSGIEGEVRESTRKCGLQIDHGRRCLPRGQGDGYWRRGRNDYVRGRTQSATGVGHTCRRVDMRNLHGGSKNQQQSTDQGKRELPPVRQMTCGLLIVH